MPISWLPLLDGDDPADLITLNIPGFAREIPFSCASELRLWFSNELFIWLSIEYLLAVIGDLIIELDRMSCDVVDTDLVDCENIPPWVLS